MKRENTQEPPKEENTLPTIGGAAIHYECTGTGTPLVMLHGNRQKHQVFQKQIAFFKERCRLILIDTRGHGRSSLGSYDLTTALLAEDILHVLDYLKIEKAILLGYSDGGNTALQLALSAPERLLAIVIISANATPGGLMAPVYYFSRLQYRLFSVLEKFHLPVRRQKQLAGLMILNPQISMEELKEIHMPALIIAGEYDIIRKTHTLSIAKAISGASLRIVRHAGHLGPFIHAEEYNAIIGEFLEGCDLLTS